MLSFKAMNVYILLGDKINMRIETNHIIIRDFERKDAENLYRTVREKTILRFMPDWAENGDSPQSYFGYIDWHQTKKNSTDIYENKRYVIALPETDEMIGMVGMGLEDTLNEVEVAYFMSEKHQRKGYTEEAVNALVHWCFSVSDIKYLILTIDCANIPSCHLAEKCGFELFEKRTPMGHRQPNMESDSYFYYRKYRSLS
jgi:RimJ/RimL family protein N-acetyltransferase